MMNDEVLIHHGIKGQRWGVRRFQNEDGTRTALGKRRERNGEQGSAKPASTSNASTKRGLTDAQKSALKKVVIAGATAAAVGVAAYGAVKYSDVIKEAAYNKTISEGRKALDDLTERSLYKDVIRSGILFNMDTQRRLNLNDWSSAVDQEAIDDIFDKANQNSSNLRNAISTLRGHGIKSTPELNRLGISTEDTSREEFEERMAKLLDDYGVSHR